MAARGRTSTSFSHIENKTFGRTFFEICRLDAPSEGAAAERHCGRIGDHIRCRRNAHVEPAVGGIGGDGLSGLGERRPDHIPDNGGFGVSLCRSDAVSTHGQGHCNSAMMDKPFRHSAR